MQSFSFKGIKISVCTLKVAVDYTLNYIKTKKPAYICVTDAGNVVNAFRKSPELKCAINKSLISLPDGRPLSLFAGLKGIKGIDRAAGPDFMEKMFAATSDTDNGHFFLGDTDEILNKLIGKISSDHKIKISGTFSPKFGLWDDNYSNEIIKMINDSNADLIWVSLGGGRQEIWMMNNFFKLNKGIMTGVGAAFRFYTGEIKRAPEILQKSGFEWFYRFLQQPSKMFRRYLFTLPFFVYYSFGEYFKKS